MFPIARPGTWPGVLTHAEIRLRIVADEKVFLIFYFFPLVAFAEVADKEPSIWTNLLISLAAVLIGLMIVRIRWWLFPASLLMVAGLHAPILSEIFDAYVGSAIHSELGAFYFWQPQVSVLFKFVVVGFYALVLKKKQSVK